MLIRLYTSVQTSRSAQIVVLSLIISVVAMAMIGGIFRPQQSR